MTERQLVDAANRARAALEKESAQRDEADFGALDWTVTSFRRVGREFVVEVADPAQQSRPFTVTLTAIEQPLTRTGALDSSLRYQLVGEVLRALDQRERERATCRPAEVARLAALLDAGDLEGFVTALATARFVTLGDRLLKPVLASQPKGTWVALAGQMSDAQLLTLGADRLLSLALKTSDPRLWQLAEQTAQDLSLSETGMVSYLLRDAIERGDSATEQSLLRALKLAEPLRPREVRSLYELAAEMRARLH